MKLNQKLEFETRLGLGINDPGSFATLVNQSLKSRSRISTSEGVSEKMFWNEKFWMLDRSSIFNQLPKEIKIKILLNLSEETLRESYFIERCGMYYGAKMSFLAETIQERQLYSLISADEALHFHWVSQFSGHFEPDSYKQQFFLKFLNEILEKESKAILVTVIQIVLEGWGLYHYKNLANSCSNLQLKKVFEEIIKDEATHHGGGVALLNSIQFSESDLKRLIEILGAFFEMVRCGPQTLSMIIDKHSGGLNRQQKLLLFEELDSFNQSQAKIETLKSLLQTARLPKQLIESLDRMGCFSALKPRECMDLNL